VFDPFFTTKEVGSGTGLGLDAARRILADRHHGSLTLESRPAGRCSGPDCRSPPPAADGRAGRGGVRLHQASGADHRDSGLDIAAVDSSAVNVALPAIGRDLGGGFAAQQWVSNAYLLTLSALILLAGSLTDRLGERRVFTAGVAGFGIGSALCAAAPSIGVLIVARALQGVSGALLTPAALAIIVSVFPKNERGAAIGKWTAWGGIGILAGPLLGGQIVDSASWRWIFVINVPLVMIALFLSRIAVPGRAHGMSGAGREGIDWMAPAFAATGLAGISFGLIEQPVLGWSDPGVWGALVIGLVMLATFIYHEAHTALPCCRWGCSITATSRSPTPQTFAMYGGIGLLGFFVTIYLQQGGRLQRAEVGRHRALPTVVMFLLSARMGKLADRYGPRPFLTIGPLLVAAGFGLMQRYGTSVSLFGTSCRRCWCSRSGCRSRCPR